MSFDSSDVTDIFSVAIGAGVALGTLGIAKEMVQGSTPKKAKKRKSKSNDFDDLFGDLRI